MKIQKTSKLFFDKYTNKVVIVTNLATLFRDRNLTRVKNTLDEYFKLLDARPSGYIEFNSRWSRRKYSYKDVFLAYKVYEQLKEEQNYSLRVEGNYLGIYSNNNELIHSILNVNGIPINSVLMAEDEKSKQFLLSKTNTIIVKKKTHEYKLKLRPLNDNATEFLMWASKLPGVKIFNKERVYRYSHGIMYVSNDKVLTLCKLYLGNNIARIDQLLLADEI